MNRSERSKSGVNTPIHTRIEQCIQECDNRTGLKIIVAPSSYAARMLRTALARQGCPLVNVEALTPAELAGHVVRTMAPDDRRRSISRAEGAYLVRRICMSMDSDEAELLGRAAFSVWATVQELRASGFSASDLERAGRRPHERVLAELHETCSRYLEDMHLRDAADVMISAIDRAEEFAERRTPELVAVLDPVRLTEQETELIRMISREAKRAVRIDSGIRRADGEWPADRAVHILSDWPVADAGGNDPADVAPQAPAISAGERREEVAAVLGDIVSRGLSFDDVEIAWTSEDPYRHELRAACTRYGIPISEAGPRRVSATRTGASVVAALRWVSAGYPVDGLVRMLRLGVVRPREGSAVTIATVLDRFPVTLAQAARPDARDRLFERARQERVNAGDLSSALTLLDGLRKIAPGRRRAAGAELLSFVESFLRTHTGTEIATDDVASSILSELAFMGSASGDQAFTDAPSAAAFAVQVLERLVIATGSREQGLTVVPLEDAGFGRASHIYVVGLDDQAGQVRTAEDSLLTEAFRNRLHGARGSGPAVEKSASLGVLLAALEKSRPGRVTRCRALYDVAQDRPLFSAVADVKGVSVDESKGEGGNPASAPVLDLTDHFLSDSAATTIELAGALFDNIERGRQAAEARASKNWTAFDGVVAPAPELLPETHAPSALENLAACPYRYFLGNILGVPVHETRDPDEWMTASDRGQILHALFERHARCRMDGDLPDDEAAWLDAEVDDLLEMFAASNPAPHATFVNEARREIAAAGAVYLHAEREYAEREPHAVEFRFGRDEHADAPPLGVELADGVRIALSGRVDRVDQTADGQLIVTDFKTGKLRGLSESDLKKLDTKLQWAVYARLAAVHFRRTVAASGYLFASTSELGLRREAAPPPDEELDRVLGQMFSRAHAGFFARSANPNGDPCTYCDFRSVCGDLTARRDETRRKVNESTETGDPFTSLIESWIS